MKQMVGFIIIVSLICLLARVEEGSAQKKPRSLERIKVSKDKKGFVFADSGKKFIPWGFNYDHDEKGVLLEDYWDREWGRIEQDFGEMKKLGANVVRIHLQLGKFMKTAETANEDSLGRLEKLVQLAEKVGLYLDLTGLGCYHKKDVPPWYDQLGEMERWEVQGRFWQAVAKKCKSSPAIFCYDLMNEPVVPGGKGKRKDWLGPDFAGSHFVQFIALETKYRPRQEIASSWIGHLVGAIRKEDKQHLITVGLVPWSLDRPGLSSGFIPEKIAGPLDFLCVHIYPKAGKLDEALDTVKGFAIGKPVVIEEMFPLNCSPKELEKFIQSTQAHASGWIGFYWGKTPAECRKSGTIGDAMMLGWLEMFQKNRPR